MYAAVEVDLLPINFALRFCTLHLLTPISVNSFAIIGAGCRTMFRKRRRSPASTGSYNRLDLLGTVSNLFAGDARQNGINYPKREPGNMGLGVAKALGSSFEF